MQENPCTRCVNDKKVCRLKLDDPRQRACEICHRRKVGCSATTMPDTLRAGRKSRPATRKLKSKSKPKPKDKGGDKEKREQMARGGLLESSVDDAASRAETQQATPPYDDDPTPRKTRTKRTRSSPSPVRMEDAGNDVDPVQEVQQTVQKRPRIFLWVPARQQQSDSGK